MSVWDKAKKAYLQNLHVCVCLKVVGKDGVICRHGMLGMCPNPFKCKDLVP